MPMLLAAVTLSLVLTPGATAGAAVRASDDGENGGVRKVDERAAADEQRIEVSIVDDQVTVHIDDERVPEERIRRNGGQITIIGPDGTVIRTIRVFKPGTMRGSFFQADDPDTFFQWQSATEDAAEARLPVMMGVLLDEPGRALCKHLDLDPGTTTMIASLYKGLPAHNAGLEPYDVIVAIEGEQPADPAALRAALREKEPGDPITLTVIQGGEKRTVELALVEWDDELIRQAETVGEAPQGGTLEARVGPTEFDWTGSWRFLGDRPDLGDYLVDEQRRLFIQPPSVPNTLRDHFDRMPENLDKRMNRLDERLRELEQRIDELLGRLDDRAEH
jgi:hypothetical protein